MCPRKSKVLTGYSCHIIISFSAFKAVYKLSGLYECTVQKIYLTGLQYVQEIWDDFSTFLEIGPK